VGVAIISHIINERDRFDVVYELHDGHLHKQKIGEDEQLDPAPTADDITCERTASFVDRSDDGSGQQAIAGRGEQ